MPVVTVEFYVDHVQDARAPFANLVYLTNLRDFWRISDLGFPEIRGVGKGNPGGSLKVECTEEDERWKQVVEILEQNGFRLSRNRAIGHGTNRFYITRKRTYTEAELVGCEFLNVYPRLDKVPIADWGRGGDDETGWIVKTNARLAKKLPLGAFSSFEVLLVADELKAKLEGENLAGLQFTPVKFDKPAKAARMLWQVAQNRKLPRCLLPRVTQNLDPYTEGSMAGAMWDEDGHVSPELRFDGEAVRAMGHFDVATTREKVGTNPKMMHTQVVVTQRFRELMAKFKIQGLEYVPVRLV